MSSVALAYCGSERGAKAVMTREDRTKGFFISFAFASVVFAGVTALE
jgi:hypothetical protein